MIRWRPGRAALYILASLFLTTGAWAGDDSVELASLPLESEGDLRYFVDFSAYRSSGGGSEVEIYVALPNDQIRFESGGDGEIRAADIVLEAFLRDADGTEAWSANTRLAPEAASELDAGDWGVVQFIREKADLAPGDYHLSLEIRDEKSLRSGLFNRMRKAKREGRVEGWIQVRDLGSESLELSDLTLARRIRAAEPESPFGRYGVDFDANPSRYYGLVLPRIRSYLEVYAGQEWQEGDTFLVHTTLQDRSGAMIREKVHRASPKSDAFVVTGNIEIEADLSAGAYALVVTLQNERTGSESTRGRDLEVLWGTYSWGRDPEEVLQEMQLIMTRDEYRTLGRLSAGAREVFLAEFWHGLDPDPSVPRNSTLNEFQLRIRYADREFRSTLQRGILTDRGRAFVRYGPPDDVTYQYNSSSFGLDPDQERVADPGERATLSSRPNPSFLDATEYREGDISGIAEQRGSATIKSKQLQIWSYDGRGHPLTDRISYDGDSHRGLKFIFADEMGNGEYQLIGSSGTSLH